MFANAGYQFTERWKVSVGLRYTRDEIDLRHRSTHPDPNDFVPPIPQVPFDPGSSGARTYEDVFWKVNIDYTPNDDWLVYASVGTCYKSGGINVGFADPLEFNIYEDETLLAVEGGFKSTWWDGRARLNAAAFYYDYEDLQVFDQTQGAFGPIFVIGNAPQADYYGGELEFLLSPLERMELLFGLSHLDTQFGTFGRPITGEDLTGNSNVYSPEWQFTGLARYEWPTPALMGGKIAASFNWSWTDEVFHTIENRSDVRAKSHWLAGARVSWFSADDSLELAFWGKNLSNTAYRIQTFDFRNSGWHTLVPNTPRMLGGEIVYSW